MVDLFTSGVRSRSEPNSVVVSVEYSVEKLHEQVTSDEQVVKSILTNV